MSVINQVLSQLEQRGVQGGIEQVRSVPNTPPPDRKVFWIVLAVGVAILLGGLFGWWLLQRKVAAIPQAKQHPNVVIAPPAAQPPALDAPAPIPRATPVVSAVAPVAPIAPAVAPVPPAADHALINAPPKPIIAPPKLVTAPPKPAPTKPIVAQKPLANPAHTTAVVASIAPAHAMTPSAAVQKQVSPAQFAEAEFNKAITAMQQGRVAEAISGYETVLSLDPKHDTARQTLIALLLENRRNSDAERVLQEGVRYNPAAFAMLLARVQIERNALTEAVTTLEKSLPYAEKQADYQAFLAALQQRQDRHAEAISHYQIALQQSPNNGIWQMGLGISLQATQRPIEAKAAFQRALNSPSLTPELRNFVQQRLRE